MEGVTLISTKKWFYLAALALPLVTGCGSAKDANKSNFEKALNAKLEKQCIGLPVFSAFVSTSSEFPISIPIRQAGMGTSAEEAEKKNAETLAPFEALEKAGLLSGSDGQAKPLWGNREVPGKIYSLTDLGKKFLHDPKSTVLCAGHYKVAEVLSFTEPGNAMGITISQVSYTVKAVDIPAWAGDEAVKAAYPGFSKETEDTSAREATLVLQNDGWTAEPPRF